VIPGAFKPSHFSVYGPDWKPKPAMAVVDERWKEWMLEIARAIEPSAYLENSSDRRVALPTR